MSLNYLVVFLFITLYSNNLFHVDTLSQNNLKLYSLDLVYQIKPYEYEHHDPGHRA